MRHLLFFALGTAAALAAPLATAQPAGTAPVPAPYVITDARAVQAAESLFQAVQALSAKVTPCVERGTGTPVACMCRAPAELRQVQDRLRAVRSAYPEWERQVVNWTDPASRQGRAISVQNLVRHSSPACPAG
jgi:hypothetical protein